MIFQIQSLARMQNSHIPISKISFSEMEPDTLYFRWRAESASYTSTIEITKHWFEDGTKLYLETHTFIATISFFFMLFA